MFLGSRKNPPLVFLHGFLGSGQSWLDIARAFSEDHFCILPDLPGHGGNTALDMNATLNFELVTDWLAGSLDGIPVSRIHLVGYSLGGRTALTFASRFPERILTLTLESASPGIPDPAGRSRRRDEDAARAGEILQNGMAAFVANWYEMPLFASLNSNPEKISAIREAASRNDPRWMAKIIRELSPGLQTPLWDSLARLSFPVLLIAGEKDGKYVQGNQKMSELIPAPQKHIVSGAGHNIHAEQPGEYIALLKDFLG